LLEPAGSRLEVLPSTVLTAEVLARVERERPPLLCIAALPPGGLAQARYLCKRLRAQFPELKILIGRWGQRENVEAMKETLRAAGADFVGTSLLESRGQVLPLIQVAAAPAARGKKGDARLAGSR